MSRVLWASAAIAIGISLTPGVALAANGKHPRSHGDNSRHTGPSARSAGSSRVALLAFGVGYGLHHGSPAVRSLQRRLVAQGIDPGPVDGRYGPLTAAAVRRFQLAHGLAVDGIVGPATRRTLADGGLSEGAGFLQHRGSQAVRLLQDRLKRAGFSPGPIDGRYGAHTQQAVRRFQQAHGLPVDGMTGTQTQGALARSRNSPRASRPRQSPRAHGRNRNRTAKPPATRQHASGTGTHAPGPAGHASTPSRHGGHRSMLTVLAATGLGALVVALVLAVREFRARRRLAAASSRPELEAPEAPVAVALLPAPAVPDSVPEADSSPSEAEPDLSPPEAEAEPDPSPPDAETEPDVPHAVPEPPSDPGRAEQVKALQRQLGVLGFDPGPVDGRFGPDTTAAVKHLQEAAGLKADGIVGPLTAEVLRRNAPEPPADDRAERVKALQRQLSWLGFEPGPADGRYGSLTTGAIRRFQEAHNLPVDGIVDRATADTLRASIVHRPSSDRIDRVTALQRQLLWLGLQPGAIDGRYGPQTTDAVRRFQEDNDLPGSGIVDPATQRALQQSVQRTGQW